METECYVQRFVNARHRLGIHGAEAFDEPNSVNGSDL
jgi:hypothetical protein